MHAKSVRKATTFALLLAFSVVLLGAYTRLTDAGLGCPDWPGCYGKMVLPSKASELVAAQAHFPETALQPAKAWTEMIHRYLAGTLGLFIAFIAFSAVRLRQVQKNFPVVLPMLLILLVLFQAALGMWTVTLKLLPIVVMAHLLGGFLIFSLLVYYRWQLSSSTGQSVTCWRWGASLALLIVFVQIALGGWVSSHYAGLACIGFPQCNGQWFPPLHLVEGFNVFAPVGTNYQGGVLDAGVRITIQYVHRVGALLVFVWVLPLTLYVALKASRRILRAVSATAACLVLVQIGLGIANVLKLLPLDVAVAHNGCAALLFAALLSMIYLTRERAVNVNY